MLVAVYRQADGVQLRWVDIGDEMYDPARDDLLHLDGPWPRLCDQRGVATGQLNLPTVDDLRSRDTGRAAPARPGRPDPPESTHQRDLSRPRPNRPRPTGRAPS